MAEFAMHYYINTNPASPLRSLEIGTAGDKCYAFLYCDSPMELAALRQTLAQSGNRWLNDAQHPSPAVIESEGDEAELLESLSVLTNQLFRQVTPASQTSGIDLMQLRGVLGFAGQGALIGAGYFSRNPKKQWASMTSLAANVVNIRYGVQKKQDETGLQHVKDSIGVMVPEAAEMSAAAAVPNEGGLNTWMQGNATRIADGMKLGAKVLFSFAGVSGGTLNDLRHGQLSIVAKLITLTGKDADVDRPAETGVGQLREQSNAISGAMEFVASIPLLMAGINMQNPTDAMMKKGASRVQMLTAGRMQIAGAALVLSGLTAKAFSPFTVKQIPRPTLYAYAASALMMLPTEQQAAKAVEVVSEIKTVLDKESSRQSSRSPVSLSPSFGDIYLQIMEQLPQRKIHTAQMDHHRLHTQQQGIDRSGVV